ncbi:hypothetical protein M378DRAFT_154660, partial [Amanita muscaria Koide BX008]
RASPSGPNLVTNDRRPSENHVHRFLADSRGRTISDTMDALFPVVLIQVGGLSHFAITVYFAPISEQSWFICRESSIYGHEFLEFVSSPFLSESTSTPMAHGLERPE